MVTACLAVLIDEVFVEGRRGLILQGKILASPAKPQRGRGY
jgi:hypothetical protein